MAKKKKVQILRELKIKTTMHCWKTHSNPSKMRNDRNASKTINSIKHVDFPSKIYVDKCHA